MNTETIFSIITPTFNQGKFIKKTIESIISQEGNFFIDYIILDGLSKDETVEIIKEESSKLIKIGSPIKINNIEFYKKENTVFCKGISFRWLSEKDKGQSDAINKGFKMAIGNYIAWLNSDDYYTHNKVLSVVDQNLKNNNIVYGGAIAKDKDGKEMWRHNPKEFSFYSSLFNQEGIPQPSIFWRREVFEKVGFLNETLHYGMDYDYWWRMLHLRFNFYRIDDFLSVQVYHPDSKSSQGDSMFEAFKPEEIILKTKYRNSLGLKKYFYIIKKRISDILKK